MVLENRLDNGKNERDESSEETTARVQVKNDGDLDQGSPWRDDEKWTDLKYILEEESVALGNGLHTYGADRDVTDHPQMSYLNNWANGKPSY